MTVPFGTAPARARSVFSRFFSANTSEHWAGGAFGNIGHVDVGFRATPLAQWQ
jgi:hypothetical protein